MTGIISKLQLALVLMTIACAVLVSSCTKPSGTPLRIGSNVWVGYEPLYLARSLGYLEPDKIKLVEYISTTQTMRGLNDGSVDAAALTLDEALLLKQQGSDIKIVLVMDYSAGADALVVHPGIESLAELKGKRIGAETNALGAYIIHRTLEHAGLSLSDITLVPTDFSDHESEFYKKNIDAVVTFDPVRSRLIETGAKILFDTRQIPGEVVDVLVVNSAAIDGRKDELNHLIDSWFSAILYIDNVPNEAASQMIPRMQISASTLINSLKGVAFPSREQNKTLLTGDTPELKKQAKRMNRVMQEINLLHGNIPSDELFDAVLLGDLYR